VLTDTQQQTKTLGQSAMPLGKALKSLPLYRIHEFNASKIYVFRPDTLPLKLPPLF